MEEILENIETLQETINEMAVRTSPPEPTTLEIRLNTLVAMMSGLNALARTLVLETDPPDLL